MNERPSQSAEKPKRTFTDAEKAMWAVAYAMTKRTRDLSPALRKAYGDGDAPPNAAALKDAELWARSIHASLVEACRLSGVAMHGEEPG